jgi:hypothetical protein
VKVSFCLQSFKYILVLKGAESGCRRHHHRENDKKKQREENAFG